MADMLKTLRVLSDPTRLRLLSLLQKQELSVNEILEITRLGQSRISTQLGQIHETGLIRSRRDGKRTFYSIATTLEPAIEELVQATMKGATELDFYVPDQTSLKRVLAKRQAIAQVYFDQVAGRFDRSYGPGRSWQALGQMLLRMLPPMVIADLGSGEGLVSELLARNAKHVIAVDNSEKMVAYGSSKALKNKIKNLEFRLGDLEHPPIEPNSVDLVILSQALHHAINPANAIASAFEILHANGQLLILDLLAHQFTQAHELYGDQWLGFQEVQLYEWLEHAGFKKIEISVVSKEESPPGFQTLLASAMKPLATVL